MTTEEYKERDTRQLLGEVGEVSDANVNNKIRLELTANSNPPSRRCPEAYAITCTLVASIICILLGFNMGAFSDSAALINKDNRITERLVEVMAGSLNIFSLLGAAMAGWASDGIGRRNTILLTGLFFFFGTLVIVSFPPSTASILFGRAITHVGVGFAPTAATVYIGEISPTAIRGHLNSFPEASIHLGILLGHLGNYASSKFHSDFGRYLLGSLGAISLILLAAGLRFLPRSPHWLILKRRLHDAKDVLVKTSKSEEEAARQHANIMVAAGLPAESTSMQSAREGVWQALLHPIPTVGHMLACSNWIHVLQQACGVDTLVLYCRRIYEKAGITSSNLKLLLTLGIHIVKATSFLIPIIYIDRVGRRRLMLISIGGMIFCFAFLGACLTALDHIDTKPEWVVGLCIASLWLCVCFYSIGLGPVTSLYSSEIFPLRLRAQGCAIGVGLSQVLSGVMALLFLPIYEAITLGGAVFLLMAISISTCWFVYVTMPETSGKTLEEMGRIFGRYSWRRSVMREIEMPTNDDATARGANSEASSSRNLTSQ